MPLGGAGALREMLRRSLGAKSFTVFWQYWNPIFGYYLGKFVFRPLRAMGLPVTLSTLITFCVSGAVHDIAASLVSQRLVFVCTPWFCLMAAVTRRKTANCSRCCARMAFLTSSWIRLFRDMIAR